MKRAERPEPASAPWRGLAAWAAGALAIWAVDGRAELADQALLLVLCAAFGARWLPVWASLVVCTVAVTAFNVAFVPPRGTFEVDLRAHVGLLVTMLAVSWVVALVVARERQALAAARRHALEAEQLRALGETLRSSAEPAACAPQLLLLLAALGGDSAALQAGHHLSGDASADERAGLELAARLGQALGPGTGRHEEQPAWYLPLRHGGQTRGAALVRLAAPVSERVAGLAHAQALCDQFAAALATADAQAAAAAAREAVAAQALRNTLLASIAHDQRTPLAAVLSAATSLADQGERLAPGQRQRLARSIAEAAQQLSRQADNTLQLARLDAGLDGPGAALDLDWQSAEELVGSALHRLRARHPGASLRARVAQGLPLLRCDALLVLQLLDNLVDNALKHGGEGGPVEILVREAANGGPGQQVLFAVRDRGPGVPPAERERIFETFRRGEAAAGRRGAGVGLALARAVARAHGGELRHRARHHGGSAFEFRLPVPEHPPTGPAA